eukprot:TRINITY_DN8703_c0_g1_i1.p1 TRINITY_DN8703_c0_g1~~TRINITY_DN8703_c0_g1_i1.p1  ORF type:complete len:209 (-),score=12.91 TRINITY_DN8703_c0_g1_i1:418-1044(-)
METELFRAAQHNEFCRVCHDDAPPLMHPCQCRGSMGFVHEECLAMWKSRTGSTRCEVCAFEYKFERVFLEPVPARLGVVDVARAVAQIGWRWSIRRAAVFAPAVIFGMVSLYVSVCYLLFDLRLAWRMVISLVAFLQLDVDVSKFACQTTLKDDFVEHLPIIAGFIGLQLSAFSLVRVCVSLSSDSFVRSFSLLFFVLLFPADVLSNS